MNTLLVMILTTIYIFFILGLIFIFYKNDYDIKKSIRYIKVKVFSCCIKDKEKLVEKVGKEEVEHIENKLLDIEDCEAPLNFPLDLCFSSELEVEEIKIREKILSTLKERNNFILDGGKQKMIVPLEATLFLTKSLSPLVTEDGSIQVISEHKKIERTELEEIRIYIKSLKDEKGELLYKDDEEIIDVIKRSITEDIKSKQSNPEKIDITKEIEEIKEKEDSVEIDKKTFDPSLLKNEDDLIFDDEDDKKPNNENILGNTSTKEKSKTEEVTLDSLGASLDEVFKEDEPKSEEVTLDSLGAILDEEITKEKPKEEKVSLDNLGVNDNKKEENEDENNFTIEENPFGDNEEIDFSAMEQSISDEVDSLDFGDFEEVEDEKDRETFYTKRKYTSVKIKQIKKEQLKEDLEIILDNDNVKKAILNNIIKTKPLIFNENKEVVFIDQKNFIFALSKIYGMESTKVLKSFESYTMQETILLSRTIASFMEDYISDLTTGNKKINRILLEKEKDLYFSFGLFLMTSSFLDVLSQDEYDLFRAMPYNTEYKISNSSEKTKTALVPSLQDVEI